MSTVFNIILLLKPAVDISPDMKPGPKVHRLLSTPYQITTSQRHNTMHDPNKRQKSA